MSAVSNPLLNPFGTEAKDKWFRKAYTWNIDQIFGWLTKVTKGEAAASVTTEESRGRLAVVLQCIIDLSLPKGSKFADDKLKPDQHFWRDANPDWDGSTASVSKFKLLRWTDLVAGRAIDYFNPYDLLGYFLSLLGPAPKAATKNNFLLPLLAVYGQWCSKIAGHAPDEWGFEATGGAGNWPTMFQITAYIVFSGKQYFQLGSSMNGCDWRTRDDDLRSWQTVVRSERFNMLYTLPNMKLFAGTAAKNWGTSPEETDASGSRSPWGNCAETYPFIHMINAKKENNQAALWGISLSRDFLGRARDAYDEYVDGGVWNSVTTPCRNCSQLIDMCGAKRFYFNKDYEKDSAPKRPANLN